MKKLLLVVVAILGINSAFSQGIEFEHGTLAEAFAKAKKENKMVFVDTYTSWCGPCKRLSKEVFPQKIVGDYFNPRFVNVKIDAEKGEGVDFAKKYKITNYPTLLFFSPDGEEMHRVLGFTQADGLINDAKIAEDPSMQLEALQKRYNEGERDLDFLMQLCAQLGRQRKMDEIYKIGAAYTKTIKMEQLYDPKVFQMVTWSTILEFEDEAYQFIYNNWDKIIEKTGIQERELQRTMRKPAGKYIGKIAEDKNNSIEDIDKSIERVKKVLATVNKEALYSAHYLAKGDIDNWYILQKQMLNKRIEEKDWRGMRVAMYMMAETINENSDVFDGSGMYKKLIKDFTQLEKKYEENFDYGAYQSIIRLYKLDGNKKKALEYLEKFKLDVEKKFIPILKRLPKDEQKFIEEIEQM
ncbi:thioredoxin family protein [Marinifilum sp.]|uniref:thioredoxin family protein n=1 Tax=Marinifilum sp. TaxID=2033137 RepID=UPI003BABE8A1